MSNMSYCGFRNTEEDVIDCLEALGEEKNLVRRKQ
ncbi:hypothetical protein CLROS_013260 [Clostridium felsineum]|uniref:Uncharacterized protein n=1 Tax=Clostridium felsineum TaxID=36839 RepID=A0A1S8L0X1_9CLOT|nr:hypothetical protein CLROS_013260 [Clostridium felsineum]URZ11031.1 hypothetical protein CROST_017470 [Clostridium felsineum]